MTLPKELTTVTRLSKTLALLMFVLMPIIAFFYGMQYQEMVELANRQKAEQSFSIPRTPTPTPSLTIKKDQRVICTQDAKLCPDGSYVGRTGPNCEFAPCP